MRKNHKAGEKLFVEVAGQTIRVEDGDKGSFQAQIFVASLGVSHYSYVEASRSQNKQDWLMAHVWAFEFMGGVTEMVVPGNLKSGVTRPCRYEPEINAFYQELGRHYELAICPVQVRKPKEKAIAEGLKKSQLLNLASCGWIRKSHNTLITGATGVGNYGKCLLM